MLVLKNLESFQYFCCKVCVKSVQQQQEEWKPDASRPRKSLCQFLGQIWCGLDLGSAHRLNVYFSHFRRKECLRSTLHFTLTVEIFRSRALCGHCIFDWTIECRRFKIEINIYLYLRIFITCVFIWSIYLLIWSFFSSSANRLALCWMFNH